jgi:hypothetical protein
MRRATDFNTAFKDVNLGDQLGDVWRVLSSAPDQARRWDREVGLTSTVADFGKGAFSVCSGHSLIK